MTKKYQVVTTSFIIALILCVGGYYLENAYAIIAGLSLCILGASCWIYAEKNDTSIASIIFDGIFFGVF